MKVDELFSDAVLAQQQGRYKDSARLCKQILKRKPNNQKVLHLIAIVNHLQGNNRKAWQYIEGLMRQKTNDLAVLVNASTIARAIGKTQKSLQLCDDILQIQPAHFGAHYNKGLVLQEELRFDEAIVSYLAAQRLRPSDANTLHNLGEVYLEIKLIDKAIAQWELLLDFEPDNTEVMLSLSKLYVSQSDFDKSLKVLFNANKIKPQDKTNYFLLAQSLRLKGNWHQSMSWFKKTIELDAKNIQALLHLGNAYASLSKQNEAIACYRSILLMEPNYHQVRSNLLIQLHYDISVSGEKLFDEHKQWAKALTTDVTQSPMGNLNEQSTKKIKIAFVSPRFSLGPVASFFLGTLQVLDCERVEVFLYSNNKGEDSYTQEFKKFGQFKHIEQLNDDELTLLARNDQIDIAVDLSGHSPGNRLTAFFSRIAPIQICWLDYFNSTGIPAMDYYLTDSYLTPKKYSHLYTESLLYHPTSRLCYSQSIPVNQQQAIKQRANIVFSSFNRLAKLSDLVIECWSSILLTCDNSQLILQAQDFDDPDVQLDTQGRFKRFGVLSDQLEFRGNSSYEELLDNYFDIDIALDPFPFTGCATTCDALWMGVPVVTLVGKTLVSRQGGAILSQLQLDDWIAINIEEYIAIAIQKASLIKQNHGMSRSALQVRMRESSVCDTQSHASELINLFESVYFK